MVCCCFMTIVYALYTEVYMYMFVRLYVRTVFHRDEISIMDMHNHEYI